MKRYQTGATLIIVLVFLILIISVGAIAVKQSVTDLKVATNDQVDTLLLNTSDSAQSDLEQAINAGGDEYTRLIGAGGPFGYFMNALGDTNRGDQLVFCYDPRSNSFFSFDKATVLTPDGGAKIVNDTNTAVSDAGYCDVANPKSYTNARNTSMVQVVITRPNSVDTPTTAFDAMPIGRDASIDNPGSSNPLFEVFTTAVLPALSNTASDNINECLKKPNKDATQFTADTSANTTFDKTLSECLQARSVPHTPLVEHVRLENAVESDTCISYGEGDGQINAKCQTQYLNANGTLKSDSESSDSDSGDDGTNDDGSGDAGTNDDGSGGTN